VEVLAEEASVAEVEAVLVVVAAAVLAAAGVQEAGRMQTDNNFLNPLPENVNHRVHRGFLCVLKTLTKQKLIFHYKVHRGEELI
jgi:hypothetical protein